LRVRFHSGLNLLTGETGSGKSIVVDALGLLFGGRASAEMVRGGAERARVSGIFDLPDGAARTVLSEAGIEAEDDELLVEREIQSSGKSRAFVASRPVTAAVLRDLAPHLGDIHGQHDQQRLFSAGEQLEILDEFAAPGELLARTGEAYRQWRARRSELEELERSEQERLRLADLWSYQQKEIESAGLKPGEDTSLEHERRVLQNVTRLQEHAAFAYSALYEAPSSALTQIRQSRKRLEELARIDPAMEGMLETLKPAEAAIEDAAFSVRDYLGNLEADPARLDDIEARLAQIDKLKRKYGTTLDEVLAFLEKVRAQMEAVENTEERRARLQKELAARAEEYERTAAALSERRKEAARTLEKKVEKELAALAMERTRFRIGFSRAAWAEAGVDAIQFLASPNVGEDLKPLEKIASGGELSRVALALKTSIAGMGKARRTPARTLVFDEVDAGIGGRAAETVGRRLKQLAGMNQVLCVTHLPQIAGFADHHYAVEKREVKGRTVAHMEELDGGARAREIGRMLSGERLTPEALKHAEQLIRMGAETT
jgi:DNA repair protein RecN (Recombination protein N)